MKEIALVGRNCHVFSEVLTAMLERGMSVNAMVDYPERLMLNDTRLTVSRFDDTDYRSMVEAFSGYHDLVLTYNDDLTDVVSADDALHHYAQTLNAAAEAGVARVIVVASPDSEAFFVGDLRRRERTDWVFISTEDDYPAYVVEEVVAPRHHHEVYA